MRAPVPNGEDNFDALDIPTVCRRSGLGKSYIYQAIRRGELRAKKFGRLTRVPAKRFRGLARCSATDLARTPFCPQHWESDAGGRAFLVAEQSRRRPAGEAARNG